MIATEAFLDFQHRDTGTQRLRRSQSRTVTIDFVEGRHNCAKDQPSARPSESAHWGRYAGKLRVRNASGKLRVRNATDDADPGPSWLLTTWTWSTYFFDNPTHGSDVKEKARGCDLHKELERVGILLETIRWKLCIDANFRKQGTSRPAST